MNDSLETENKALREKNVLLRAENAQLRTEIQTLKLQMEELRTIVFGKKRKAKDDHNNLPQPPRSTVVRTTDSYKRPLPVDHSVGT